ncbi:MDR family MFS transporter [Lederbergia wuyishanensis]|uniref:EmrB/QacA subfamily drug resistance transporter n=1 Tax=Lederbergia wuyishanensis TaxID=1347903 RepID=A0ABU0CYS0_9BACI|nr:MDR family MFS transporter [Lederbergia wuyishanensis]MCJ8005919.1 MFS transporter [Lederbergia wuyishanensis]MDQ0341284.1 EmrB/QacA subfamily drug resistance transporter [Lederbergia wuyishanensis]
MVAKESKLGFVVTGLLLAILMSAMDNTIVATSMGTIVADLGGFDKFVWVTSAYLVTVMAGTPIFGKLSDMYGRKRFFIFGLVVFLIGSILCGTANTITQLSIYRAIQGVGGGALMPIAFTIVFDIFPPEKRGKMTGLFGAVFGTSSLFGPLLGAYISEYIGWHWIFFINVPIGIISFALIFYFYKESLEHKSQKIDWWGAFTLVGAVVCLMFALELGGNQYAWGSWIILGLFSLFIAFFIVFLLVERKATEPIISFQMFKQRLFATSNAIAFFYGATFIVATIYIPIYIQGVFGGTATNSGLILTPMMLGSVFGSQSGGLLTTKTSYRNIMILSGIFFVTGIFLLGTLTPDTSRIVVTIFMIITGYGVGFNFSTLSMSAIHNFDMRQRGSATSSLSFFRSLGMTLGITIFGIIQRNIFTNSLTQEFAGMGNGKGFGDSRQLLSPEARKEIPANVLDKITDALSNSIAQTFIWALIPALLAVLFIFLMSKERVEMPVKKART